MLLAHLPPCGTILRDFQQKSIFTTSITDKDGKIEEETSDGLVTGHAYAILDTTRLKVGNDRIEMVKLRNPWAKAGIHRPRIRPVSGLKIRQIRYLK